MGTHSHTHTHAQINSNTYYLSHILQEWNTNDNSGQAKENTLTPQSFHSIRSAWRLVLDQKPQWVISDLRGIMQERESKLVHQIMHLPLGWQVPDITLTGNLSICSAPWKGKRASGEREWEHRHIYILLDSMDFTVRKIHWRSITLWHRMDKQYEYFNRLLVCPKYSMLRYYFTSSFTRLYLEPFMLVSNIKLQQFDSLAVAVITTLETSSLNKYGAWHSLLCWIW